MQTKMALHATYKQATHVRITAVASMGHGGVSFKDAVFFIGSLNKQILNTSHVQSARLGAGDSAADHRS